MLDVDDIGLPNEGRTARGFLLISGAFISIELHITWDAFEDAFQTGTYEYRINDTGDILRATISSFSITVGLSLASGLITT